MTTYRLLAASIDEPARTWKDWGTVEASNADAAVRAGYLKNQAGDVKAIVAVPERSWKPKLIRSETVTKVVLGEST